MVFSETIVRRAPINDGKELAASLQRCLDEKHVPVAIREEDIAYLNFLRDEQREEVLTWKQIRLSAVLRDLQQEQQQGVPARVRCVALLKCGLGYEQEVVNRKFYAASQFFANNQYIKNKVNSRWSAALGQVREAYKALIVESVAGFNACQAKHKTMAEQHQMASHAVNCFASHLPWSHGLTSLVAAPITNFVSSECCLDQKATCLGPRKFTLCTDKSERAQENRRTLLSQMTVDQRIYRSQQPLFCAA